MNWTFLGPFLWLLCQLVCYGGWIWAAIKGFLPAIGLVAL